LASCTVIFDQKDSPAIDASVFPGVRDAAPQVPCTNSTALDEAGSVISLSGGHVVDFNSDGVDDVLLIALNPGRAPEVFVHDGSCLVEDTWNYQYLWQPQGNGGPTGRLDPHALTFVPSRNGFSSLALVGEDTGDGWLATYEITGVTAGEPVISNSPDILNPLPPHLNTGICRDAEAEFFLRNGDFDDDLDGVKNDLISSGGQSWVYRLKEGVAPPWDANCANNSEPDIVPERISGPGTRLGYVPVPLGGAKGDEVIDARSNRVEWIFDFGSDIARTDWPGPGTNPEVDGVALSRSAIADDGVFDLVGWNEGDPIQLHAASLTTDPERAATFVTTSFSAASNRPSFGSVLPVAGVQRLLLVVDNTLYLMDPTASSPIFDKVELPFSPLFLVTPRWGPDGQAQVYSFDVITGEMDCRSFDDSGMFTICD
jgi:hypothetical protein